jgi:hypothetical protein
MSSPQKNAINISQLKNAVQGLENKFWNIQTRHPKLVGITGIVGLTLLSILGLVVLIAVVSAIYKKIKASVGVKTARVRTAGAAVYPLGTLRDVVLPDVNNPSVQATAAAGSDYVKPDGLSFVEDNGFIPPLFMDPKANDVSGDFPANISADGTRPSFMGTEGSRNFYMIDEDVAAPAPV